ncbi:hypothetical protein NIES2101_36675 [Calothrix sp. HK-06]|nr:hypothetical protein NIES2101_36675 [Calothrix sp. HK-06]
MQKVSGCIIPCSHPYINLEDKKSPNIPSIRRTKTLLKSKCTFEEKKMIVIIKTTATAKISSAALITA